MPVPDNAKSDSYFIYNQYGDNLMEPVGPIGLISLSSSESFTAMVNDYLYSRRLEYTENSEDYTTTRPGFLRKNYFADIHGDRFTTGEGKVTLASTVRGHDIFILIDVLNYSKTYELFGQTKHMTPDEHYQDLKRIILAISGKARRINIIMPFLYESRQHKRNGRESLDSAFMLEELHKLGVSNILTFDAHDPRVANAAPMSGFENISAHYQVIKALKRLEPALSLTNDNLMVISPDEGALQRAMYYSTMLGCQLGTFYKRRDYTQIVEGRNPIISHEFLGDSAEGKDILIVDDMIASGESMLDIAREMRRMNAGKIYCTATFGLFTSGIDNFNKAYEEGVIDKVLSTNLTYLSPEVLSAPWFVSVNMAKYIALLIDAINHDASLSLLLDPAMKIQTLLDPGNDKVTAHDED